MDDDDVRAAFERFDEDGNGEIDLIEFRKLLTALGSELEPAIAEKLFDVIDGDETGLIGFEEFREWWTSRAPIGE